MHVNSGTIQMESSRKYSAIEARSRSYRADIFSRNDNLQDFENLLMNENDEDEVESEESEKSGKGTANTNISDMFAGLNNRIGDVKVAEIESDRIFLRDQLSKIREECINLLLRLLFPDRALPKSYHVGTENANSNSLSGMELTNAIGGRFIRLSYGNQYYFEEEETTDFNAMGKVVCSDGREIDFGISLEMSRSFAEYYSEEISSLEVSLTDPLVINFDTDAVSLGNQTFKFDLDADGVEEEINNLVRGSGFLALDLNEDGIINDGSELFGTQSQNGFADLMKYDQDKDGFIDEDDEVFDKLKIWCPNEDGSFELYSLKDKGIGAIYLGSQSTDFSLTDIADNSLNGMVRRTGVFLFENGNAGTIQQIDMARHENSMQRALAAYA